MDQGVNFKQKNAILIFNWEGLKYRFDSQEKYIHSYK